MIIITTFLLIVSIIFPTWKISSLVRGMGGVGFPWSPVHYILYCMYKDYVTFFVIHRYFSLESP